MFFLISGLEKGLVDICKHIPRPSNMPEIQSGVARYEARAREERRAELAKKAERFRILIVGRANAGKTTILKKICNTTEDPEIYDRDGQKVVPDLCHGWFEKAD
jgi:predicted GTPase